MPLTAVVIGATGLIGEQVTNLLLDDPTFAKVRVLVRRPLDKKHPKLEVQTVNFSNIDDYRQKLGSGDCVFCAVGTTQSKVKGDLEKYRATDYDIPVNAAKLAKDAGFKTFVVVSSSGAGTGRSNFYLKLKGQMENAIGATGIAAVHIFRPSMLLGPRKEFRFGELAVKWMMPFFNLFMFGGMRNYKGIHSAVVARAMVAAGKVETGGTKVYHYDEIRKLANQ